MPVILPEDLHTHMYAEVISEITRGDATIATAAIDAAIKEAKMYLAKYDLAALFGDEDQEPDVTDAYLNSLLKDIACHYLLRPSSTGAEQSLYQAAYDEAIASLKRIQAGIVQPDGWPQVPVPKVVPDTITLTSNPKRNNYY